MSGSAYFPNAGGDWQTLAAAEAGFYVTRLRQAVAFAEAHESIWPRDMERAGALPGMTAIEPSPWNEILGPIAPRGGPNGVVIRRGRIVAQWGDIDRADMTFSVAKSYLSILAGVAVGDGLVDNLDEPVAQRVQSEHFAGARNGAITWRHLLTQSSEWEGTLWDKPDLVDRHRQVGPGADNSRKGKHRELKLPGTHWEYNDVRVNVLALALLHVFRMPLPEVLKTRIMDPIGASETWRWHGYRNAFVEIDGRAMQSVPGGTHWGGGIQIATSDHARFALLVHREGVWNGRRLLPDGWCVALREPSGVNPGYGLLWWLNTGRKEWPAASASAYAAVGAGSNIILIEPEDDLIVIARWIDSNAVNEFIARVLDAKV